jgi:hypothetical protein
LWLKCQSSLQGSYRLSPPSWANSSSTCTSSLLSQQWQSCLSQKGSYKQTTSSKLVDISNRL